MDRGAGSRNRTHDQRFTKPLLYQLSYAGYARDFTRAGTGGATTGAKTARPVPRGPPRDPRLRRALAPGRPVAG